MTVFSVGCARQGEMAEVDPSIKFITKTMGRLYSMDIRTYAVYCRVLYDCTCDSLLMLSKN